MRVLIEVTTAAAEAIITIPDDEFISIAQSGLGATEKLTFEIDLDGTWTAIVPEVVLDATSNLVQIAGPNSYRISKGTTVAPVTVYISE